MIFSYFGSTQLKYLLFLGLRLQNALLRFYPLRFYVFFNSMVFLPAAVMNHQLPGGECSRHWTGLLQCLLWSLWPLVCFGCLDTFKVLSYACCLKWSYFYDFAHLFLAGDLGRGCLLRWAILSKLGTEVLVKIFT
jgi:hypothetical protein